MSTAPDLQTMTAPQRFRKRAAGESAEPTGAPESRRCVVAVRVENHIGALNRVANLFSARGFNLDAVTVGPTEDPSISRMTLTTSGTARQVEQTLAGLEALVDVIEVEDLTDMPHVERELCLVRIGYTETTRPALMDFVSIFRGTVTDVTPDSMMVELSGPVSKINAFIGLVRHYGITDLARSGRLAMRRALPYGE